eukprot:7715529-Pyramimonas_sp.AAC.1
MASRRPRRPPGRPKRPPRGPQDGFKRQEQPHSDRKFHMLRIFVSGAFRASRTAREVSKIAPRRPK